MTDPYEHLDAVYVLGALEPAERVEFEEHLAGCPECRARVEALRPTVGLLAAARAHGAVPDEAPPDTLLPAMLRQAGRERARRRWVTSAVGAVAAACLVALAVLVWPSSSGPGHPAPRAFAPVRQSPVQATAVLVSRPWGTEIDVRCRYEDGVYAPEPYLLDVVDTADATHPAGSWTLVPGHAMDFTGGTSVPRARIKYVRITLPNGAAILQLAG